MSDDDYAALLEKAKRERAQAVVERIDLNKRIEQLDAIIMALRTLVERPKIDPARGITDGIKASLMSGLPQGVYPTTIRAQLEKAGFDFSRQANAMASIHAILKRFEKKGLVRAVVPTDGKSVYYVWETDPKKPKSPTGGQTK